MISLHEEFSMFKNQTFDLPQILSGYTTVTSQKDRIKPELALSIGGPNVDVGGLAQLIRVKVKTVRADA
jgi:hypothetical protein